MNFKIKFKTSNCPNDYQDAVSFMENRVFDISQNKASELIWLTCHNALYTAGISAKDGELLSNKIPVYKTNRGGKYTYHDEGIRIIYIMLNLKNVFYPYPPDVGKFVKMLENWIIKVLEHFNIKGEIRSNRVGIWVKDNNGEEKKIAAIGIKLKKWISYHGIAINIHPNMEGFNGIIPCGIKDFGVTSIFDLKGKASFSEIDKIIKKEFTKIFTNYCKK